MNKQYFSFFERSVYFLFGRHSLQKANSEIGAKWLNEMRKEAIDKPNLVYKIIPDKYDMPLSTKDLAHLFLVSSENVSSEDLSKDEDVLKLDRSDFFKKKSVCDLLEEGIQRMRTSIDPVHDWTHVRRVIGYADMIWQQLPTNKRPDWGAVVLSAVWHDAARVDWLGPAEDRWTWIKKVPGGQDMSILYAALRDASKSAVLFIRAAKRHKIPKSLRKMLTQGIRSTANHRSKKTIKRMGKFEVLAKIIHDADTLDVLSIGRLEDFIQNTKNNDIVDKKFRDRYFANIWFFIMPYWEKHTSLEESQKLRKVVQFFTEVYLDKFYPEEYSMISKVMPRVSFEPNNEDMTSEEKAKFVG